MSDETPAPSVAVEPSPGVEPLAEAPPANRPASSPHRFKPGQSGNPSGRPKDPPELRELRTRVRRWSWPLLRNLYDLARSSRNERVVVAATQLLLEFAHGKPAQALTNPDGSAILPAQITIENTIVDAATAAALYQQLIGGRSVIDVESLHFEPPEPPLLPEPAPIEVPAEASIETADVPVSDQSLGTTYSRAEVIELWRRLPK